MGRIMPMNDQLRKQNEFDSLGGGLSAEGVDVSQGALGFPQESIHTDTGNTDILHLYLLLGSFRFVQILTPFSCLFSFPA